MLYIYNELVKEFTSLYILHNARKECLMKNKKALGILALLLASGLILAGCNKNNPDNSSSQNHSSSNYSDDDDSSSYIPPVLKKYTVTFKVEGEVVQTSEVYEGDFAFYLGDTPTKENHGEVLSYRFRGWDRDLYTPITEDTEFNALFSGYAPEIKIGDFETYTSNSELADNGWYALGYSSGGYTKQTSATVSLSNFASQGNKALRFDGWANQNDYKISREFSKEELYNKAVNALKFSLKSPKFLTTKVILQGQITVAGQTQNAYFSHVINVPSNDYVDYVIPFDSPAWALWGEAGKSMVEVAEWIGFHQDDVINYLTSIEFFFKGSDGAGGQKYFSLLDDVSFVTLENPSLVIDADVELLDKYSAKTFNDKTFILDIADSGAATARIIDLPHPIEIVGNVTTSGKEVTFTSNDSGATLTYTGKLVDGGQSIEFVSASSNEPAIASEIDEMNFLEVQTVDNYEQYTEDGQAYCEKYPDKDARYGCRGAYYSEYYKGSGYTEWGGNGWSLLGGEYGDQLKLKNDGQGHESNNYLCMKNSASFAMRYMQWGLYDGSAEKQSFRGSTLSFWARTNGRIPSFKVTMYSQSRPRNGTQDSNMRRLEVTDASEAQIDEWTHYELELNPNLTYYGFMITMEKNNSSDTYLYIDDVEVYSASPYAKYISPYHVPTGVTYYGRGLGGVNTSIEIIDETNANLMIPGFNQVIPATYVKDDYRVTFDINGLATYVADISLDQKTLTYVSSSSTNTSIASLLSNLNMKLTNYAENAETYIENGSTIYYEHEDVEQSGARGAYYIDLHNGGNKTSPVGGEGWQLPSSASSLSINTANKVDGKQSLSLQSNKNGDMRFMQWELYKGTAKEITGVDTFSVYLKSNRNAATNIKLQVFKVKQVTTETQSGSDYVVEKTVNMTAKQDWTKFSVSLDANQKYYGFAIMIMTDNATTGVVYMDKAYYSNNYDDPENNFYAKEGMTLSGNLETGSKAAQITFNEGNTLEFTCTALDMSAVDGTYVMEMSGEDQLIKITIGNSVITGTYEINNEGAVTLTITSVTGDLTSEITGGTLSGSLIS